MLVRIALFIAILAGLAVGVLNFVMVKDKITTLQAHDKNETELHQKFENQYNTTQAALDKTNAVLKETQATLASTTEKLGKAEEEAANQTKRADKLNEDLTKTKQERDTAQDDLARFKGTGYSPEQIVNMGKQYKALEDTLSGQREENKLLGQKVVKLQNELNLYKIEDYHVPLPANLKGKVLVADPKWNFVVVDVGQDQQVLKDGELLVNRNGKLVAKVRVRTVQKDRSVANVMPGWQLGEVMEGDTVVPAYPAQL